MFNLKRNAISILKTIYERYKTVRHASISKFSKHFFEASQ